MRKKIWEVVKRAPRPSRSDPRCHWSSRGCHEDATSKLLSWKFGLKHRLGVCLFVRPSISLSVCLSVPCYGSFTPNTAQHCAVRMRRHAVLYGSVRRQIRLKAAIHGAVPYRTVPYRTRCERTFSQTAVLPNVSSEI